MLCRVCLIPLGCGVRICRALCFAVFPPILPIAKKAICVKFSPWRWNFSMKRACPLRCILQRFWRAILLMAIIPWQMPFMCKVRAWGRKASMGVFMKKTSGQSFFLYMKRTLQANIAAQSNVPKKNFCANVMIMPQMEAVVLF